jgi:oleandomycin transport system ATP-binding protein
LSEPAILLDDVSKSFDSLKALEGIELEVPEGVVLGLLGPAGAGKSTLVRILATLLRPDSGRALVAGFDVLKEARQVRRLIGLTTQSTALDELLSGRENLVLAGGLLGLGRKQARSRADELLEVFSLTPVAGNIARTYSPSMRRRLDLAASMVGNPRVLLLDEPTNGLAGGSRAQLWDHVSELAAEGTTVLVATPELEEAYRLANGIVVLDHGRVIEAGTPEELKSRLGGHIIDVTPDDPRDAEKVRRILKPLAIKGASVELDGRILRVPVADPGVFWTAISKLKSRNVGLAQIALREADLDEIFLALTGHVSEEAPVEPGAGQVKP